MNRSLVFGVLCVLAIPVPVMSDPCPSVVFPLTQTYSGYLSNVEHLHAIDYDHDGTLDLIGTIRNANNDANLYSWRGAGNGTFEAPVSLGATQVTDLQVINVNNDAYDDLVVADGQFHISVRLGGPSGFGSTIVNTISLLPDDIQLGNFNEGDSNVDLVVSTFAYFDLYRGNGDGTFTKVRRVVMSENDFTTDHTVADFNNDGRFDVAVAKRTSQQIHIYFRNADGTFTPMVALPGRKLARGDRDG